MHHRRRSSQTQRHAQRCPLLVGLVSAGLLVGCSARPSFEPGTRCELNTDCDSAFVCRLGYCRIECRDARDCPAGLSCFFDAAGLGACQLPPETTCALQSDCIAPLVCRASSCTNACVENRDCPAGSQCASDGTTWGCLEVATTECIYDHECTAPLVCGLDQRCRAECWVDRDCFHGQRCDTSAGPGVCTSPLAGSVGVPRLALGKGHTCFAKANDDLYCWGANDFGQLGIGSNAVSTTAVSLVLQGARTIAAGSTHTLALAKAATAETWLWGSNGNAELGQSAATSFLCGATIGLTYSCTPLLYTRLDPVQMISLSGGTSFSCALHTTGVSCWGLGGSSQLGANSSVTTELPIVVGVSSVPLQLRSGREHTCARMANGTVECWGGNLYGQSTPGSKGATTASPTPVAGLTNVAEVATGSDHTCARLTSGGVSCWGRNSNGQLGGGSSQPTSMVVATSLTNAVGLALGGNHSCARLADGTMACWGDNSRSQLAAPPPVPPMASSIVTPTVVKDANGQPLTGVDAIGAGALHTCAHLATGLYCWGDNTTGQLGPTCPASLAPNPCIVPVP